MKNFSLPSLLVGLVLGVVVGAGAMSLAGTDADNSDLQGRFGSVPSAEELKEVDPEHLGDIFDSGGDCEITNCDLLVEIEDIQDSIGSWTLASLLVEENFQRLHNSGYIIDEVTGNSSWTLKDLAERQYSMSYNSANMLLQGSSWTLDNLAAQMYDVCN